MRTSGFIFLLATLLVFGTCKNGYRSEALAYEDSISIPTYLIGAADSVPHFFMPQVYQGAQKHVYPYRWLGSLRDSVQSKKYKALILENEFVRTCILPELGGRVYYMKDKTTGYDYFYHNRVIKPALIGMAGAWLSGGIEWNIPHHHRVSTCMPVDYRITEHADGSKSIWVGEYEKRHGMRWNVSMRLYPGRNYLETGVHLYNETGFEHAFLMWVNAAVHANENYRVIFPRDVNKAVFHNKVEFTDWPVSRQYYRGIDFTEGVDISYWKNTSSPTSFFVWDTDYDFLAGLDLGKGHGTVMVGDRENWPGKKMWNWGDNDVGRMWDRMLTDEDGPYLELMMGAYSDNQPDYSWIQPFTSRSATLYMYPVTGLSDIHNANRHMALNVQQLQDSLEITLYPTRQYRELELRVQNSDTARQIDHISLNTAEPAVHRIDWHGKLSDTRVSVHLSSGKELIHYHPPGPKTGPLPRPYSNPPEPKAIESTQAVFNAGIRLEQFSHAHLKPEPYYEEVLKRDPLHIEALTRLGILTLKKYDIPGAKKYLQKAYALSTSYFRKPEDAAPAWYLGMACYHQDSVDRAYELFNTASYQLAYEASARYMMALIACRQRDYRTALKWIEASVRANSNNLDALCLNALILRKLNDHQKASALAEFVLDRDPMHFYGLSEFYFISLNMTTGMDASEVAGKLIHKLGSNLDNYLQTAAHYSRAGQYQEAIDLLLHAAEHPNPALSDCPLLYIHLARLYRLNGEPQWARASLVKSENLDENTCFPWGYESLKALNACLEEAPDHPLARYLRGNLLADHQPVAAVRDFHAAYQKKVLPMTARNIAFLYANRLDQKDSAWYYIRRAVEGSPSNPRFLVEQDRIARWLRKEPALRYNLLKEHAETVYQSDEATGRLVQLALINEDMNPADSLLYNHHFNSAEGRGVNAHHPWVHFHWISGLQAMENKEFEQALHHFKELQRFPRNLEIPRNSRTLIGPPLMGLTYRMMNEPDSAEIYFRQALEDRYKPGWGGNVAFGEVMYYRALAAKQLGMSSLAKKLGRELGEQGTRLAGGGHEHDAAYSKYLNIKINRLEDRARGFYYLGLAKFLEGNTAQGKALLQKSLSTDPGFLEAEVILRYHQ